MAFIKTNFMKTLFNGIAHRFLLWCLLSTANKHIASIGPQFDSNSLWEIWEIIVDFSNSKLNWILNNWKVKSGKVYLVCWRDSELSRSNFHMDYIQSILVCVRQWIGSMMENPSNSPDDSFKMFLLPNNCAHAEWIARAGNSVQFVGVTMIWTFYKIETISHATGIAVKFDAYYGKYLSLLSVSICSSNRGRDHP